MTDEQFKELIMKLDEIRSAIKLLDIPSLTTLEIDLSDLNDKVDKISKRLGDGEA